MSLPFQKDQVGEIIRLIARAESLRRPWSADDRRSADRVGYLRANISMQVKHPNGSEGGAHLLTRNISSGGISAWHRAFLYPESVCVLELSAREGDSMKIVADVKNCRHMNGQYHESNIAFREKIEIDGLLSLSELEAIRPPEPPEEPVNLAGTRVLITACDEGVSGLVRAALAPMGCTVKVIEGVGGAFDQLRRSPYDVVVCGDLIQGAERATMLLRLRTNGRFHGHVLLAGFREGVASGLIAGDPDKKCAACDPFDSESIVDAMPRRRKAA